MQHSATLASALVALLAASCPPAAAAQSSRPAAPAPAKPAPTPTPTEPTPTPTPAPAPGPAVAARPTVAVMDFDYGTLTTQWWGQYDIGRGVATQLVYALVEDGRLRLIERSKLATVLGEQDFAASERASPEAAKLARVGKALGVRYIVAGSITKFATSDRKFGGGTVGTVARGVLGPIGGLSFRKARQEVALTARFIDTTTGEIVASAQAEGVAKKGQGAAIEGGGPGGVGFGTESPEFKASGIAEAQQLAVTTLSPRAARARGRAVGRTAEAGPDADPRRPRPRQRQRQRRRGLPARPHPHPWRSRPHREPGAAQPAGWAARSDRPRSASDSTIVWWTDGSSR